MTEKMCVVSSEDYGRDEQSAMVSLSVREYSSDTNRLVHRAQSLFLTLGAPVLPGVNFWAHCKTNIHTLFDKPLKPSKKCLYYWMILPSTDNN